MGETVTNLPFRGSGHQRGSALELDHLVVVTPDLEAGVRWIEERLGARPVAGGRHPAWGTWNALLALDDGAYLEVLAPDPAATPAPGPGLAGVHRATEPRLATWAARVPDLAEATSALRALGLDPGDPEAGERRTADGRVLRWRLTDPLRVRAGGVVPFLIDWGETPHPSETIGAAAGRVVRLSLRHPEPDRVARWLAALGAEVEVERDAAPGVSAEIETVGGRVVLE